MRIRQASSSEVDACAAVLGRALQNDEVIAALIPGAHRREQRLGSSYNASLRTGAFVDGVVDIVVSSTDEILGVAAWEAPGHRTKTSTRLRQLPRYVRAIGVRHLPGALRASRAFAEHRPSDPHWYLADIGIDPCAAGQGLGTELLRHRLALIDRERTSAYLEATSAGSQRLYERFGFVAQAILALPADTRERCSG
ncbi:GNAT family N-acetyltransferase [Curtobacterium flaccumfaciens]|uniref:GNAT family N-acetyltransferase n=1 Tax=Curtobacterium flaccumfaciens TaxID=2035 RepID=UPI0016048B76|nr:GNAT family N-acetyltransferase [Curtobacterium flaccumfaciens]